MSMYNKLFTKILDSSIWMEPTPTRIVWLTLIAAMDEDGMVQFASIPNVAHRAVVSLEEAEEAIRKLESPDEHSSDPENEGRRIERVNGGWVVLNAHKYRELVTRAVIKEQTRIRVAKYREKKKGNADVTQELRTPSDTDTASDSGKEVQEENHRAQKGPPCTLEQAKAVSDSIGVSREEAEHWWTSRASDSWMKGGEGNRRPVGNQWQHDMKAFAMAVRKTGGSNYATKTNGRNHGGDLNAPDRYGKA